MIIIGSNIRTVTAQKQSDGGVVSCSYDSALRDNIRSPEVQGALKEFAGLRASTVLTRLKAAAGGPPAASSRCSEQGQRCPAASTLKIPSWKHKTMLNSKK